MEECRSEDTCPGPRALSGRSGVARSRKSRQTSRQSMMRTAPIAILICVTSSSAWAQSTDTKTIIGLEACFKQARSDELTCSTPTNDPVQRQNCLQYAQRVQLDCLKQVSRDALAAVAPPPRQTASSEPPTNSIPPKAARPAAPQPSDANVPKGETATEPGKVSPASDPSPKS